MADQILPAGLAVSLGGALVVALADTWLSRLILTHLDAVESDMIRLVQVQRSGGTEYVTNVCDPKRDRRENIARTVKTLGWLALVAGISLQLAAYLAGLPN